MRLYINKKVKFWLYSLMFVLSILPFIGKIKQDKTIEKKSAQELFNPDLAGLNSVQKITDFADEIYKKSNRKSFDTSAYVFLVSKIVKERFRFGLSHYSYADNWIASVCGLIIWDHFSAIVNPDDILKHSEGLCSQQTIVFMETLKNKGIKARSVGLGGVKGPGHFLCEVFYNKSWRLHDVTLEPKWDKVDYVHNSMEYYLKNKDSLYLVYEHKLERGLLYDLTENVRYGEINSFPAKKMIIFHRVTYFLTYLFPFILLFLALKQKFK